MEELKTIEYYETFDFWRTEISSVDTLSSVEIKSYWERVWKTPEGVEIKREKNLDNPLQFSFSEVTDMSVLAGFLAVTDYMKDQLAIHLTPEPEPVEEPPAE